MFRSHSSLSAETSRSRFARLPGSSVSAMGLGFRVSQVSVLGKLRGHLARLRLWVRAWSIELGHSRMHAVVHTFTQSRCSSTSPKSKQKMLLTALLQACSNANMLKLSCRSVKVVSPPLGLGFWGLSPKPSGAFPRSAKTSRAWQARSAAAPKPLATWTRFTRFQKSGPEKGFMWCFQGCMKVP